MIHIGDEAMFEEFLVQARRRGVDSFIGISSNPSETASRYGIDAVRRVGFDGERSSSVARMDLVHRAASGHASALPGDDPAWAVIDAIRSADGVVVTGGGNISSIWPTHIFERATIAELAAHFGKPFVISGQTLGPALVPDDAALVSRMLASAALVGLREQPSYDLAGTLEVEPGRRAHTIDDASYLGSGIPVAAAGEPYCLVTLASHIGDDNRGMRDTVIERLAALLDHAAASTGLEIVFLAHFGALHKGVSRGDTVMHNAVAARMSSPTRMIAPTDAATAAQFARSAELLISSRYHPVVFATSAAVPTLAVSVDEYTGVKLRGALGHAGQSGILPVTDVIAGDGIAILDHVWADRSGIRSRGAATANARLESSNLWWDRVIASLSA